MEIRNVRGYALEIAVTGQLVEHGETVEVDADLGRSLLEQPANWQPASGPVPHERPAQSAPKSEWVAFAVFTGMDEDDANGLTKAELIDRYDNDAAPSGEED